MALLKSAVRALLALAAVGLVAVNAHTQCAKNCYAEIASDNGCVGRDPNSTHINLECFCKLPMTVVIPQCEAACRPSGNWHENDNDICGPLQPTGEIAARDVEISVNDSAENDDASVDIRDTRKFFAAKSKVCDQRCYHSLKREKECNGHICTILDLTINRDVSDDSKHVADEVVVKARDAAAVAEPKFKVWSNCGEPGISCKFAPSTGGADTLDNTVAGAEEQPLIPTPDATTELAVNPRDADATAAPKITPWSNCGMPGISCAVAVTGDDHAIEYASEDTEEVPLLPSSDVAIDEDESNGTNELPLLPSTPSVIDKRDDTTVLPRIIPTPTLCGYHGISCAKVDQSTADDISIKRSAPKSDGTTELSADIEPIDLLPRSITPPTLCGFHGMSCASVVNREADAPVPTTFETVFRSDLATSLGVVEKDVPFTPITTVAAGSTASRSFTLMGPPPRVTPPMPSTTSAYMA